MSIVPSDVPMTWALCDRTIDALAQRYPFIETETLATTIFGRTIRVLRMGTGETQVIHSAAHHANEWLTATLLLRFAEDCAQEIEQGRDTATVHILPMVDPDGVDLVTGALVPGDDQYERALAISRNYPNIPFPEGWKANLNGVDLNLQYPAGWLMAREIKFRQGYVSPAPRDYVGRAPLSQIEAQALYDYTQRVDPDLVLAWHSQGQVIYWQYGGIEVPGAGALAEEFARVSGYALEDTPFASSFAGYKDWFIQAFRRPGFTIEVGTGTNPLPLSQLDAIYADTLPIFQTANRS